MLMVLSNLFLPIPSQVVLPLAGFLVGRGDLSFPLVLLAATAGTLTSALAMYYLGRRLGEERVRWFVRRLGRYAPVGESTLDRAHRRFERHGGAAVTISFLIPGVGNLVSLPAGLEGMPVRRFVAHAILGSGLWNAALIGAGWALGSRWQAVREYVPYVEYAVLAVAVGAAAWFFWRRRGASG